MANFNAKFTWLLMFCLMLSNGSECKSDPSNEINIFSRISKELGISYHISHWQIAILITCLLCLITSKSLYLRLANFAVLNYDLIIKTVVGAILTSICACVFLPIYLILFTLKKCVEIIVYCQYGNSAIKSTGTDVMWGSGPKVSQPFITVTLKLDGEPDINKIKEHINKKVINFETSDGRKPFQKFKQSFHHFYGYFFWKDCDLFDIDNHIKLINLTKLYPNFPDRDSENHFLDSTDHLLCHYASEFGFQMLPDDQPQWEINFLQTDTEKCYIMYFKLHHAIGDGVSLLRLLLEHIVDNPVKVSLLHQPKVHPIKKFLYTLWSFTFIPFTLKFMFLDRASNPLHGKGLSGNKILVTSDKISLDLIKKIKDKTKTAVIDVLFSCLSFSIANHFQKRSTSVKTVNMFFPIGVEDINAPIALCNKFTIGITSLLTITDHEMQATLKNLSGEEPALERLFQIKKSLDEVKRGPTILALFYLTSTIIEVLPLFLAKRVFSSQGLTLSFSNVPGPQHELFSLGHQLTEMRFWVPDREPNGCGISVMSYQGHIRLGVSVDESLIESKKDVDMIVDDFGKQLFKLSQELNLPHH